MPEEDIKRVVKKQKIVGKEKILKLFIYIVGLVIIFNLIFYYFDWNNANKSIEAEKQMREKAIERVLELITED